MSTISDRAALVSAAQLAIARGSKSFTLASQIFAKPIRERAWLLYYWCRACDDIVDGQDHGGALTVQSDTPERVAHVRELTERALAGEVTGVEPFDALAVVARECSIPRELPLDVIEGFAMDARDWRPKSENDLLSYSYYVAGAVGRMMALVMGVSPRDSDTLDRATDLGIAFQLSKIARDLDEDDKAARCYLPMNWLAEADIAPGEQMRPYNRSRLADMAWWLADMVGDYEASARVGAARLPFRSRWAVLSAASIYGEIAREVDRRDAQAWDHRVVVGKRRKAWLVVKALGQALVNHPQKRSRDGLWTRDEALAVAS
jgi:phytoene synthase